jgi:hypothetical protein
LQESGQLFLCQNERVSHALRGYLLTRARAHDSGASLELNTINLAIKYPHLIKVMKPMFRSLSANGVMTRERNVYQSDLAAMRPDQGFLNSFEVSQSGFGAHMQNNLLISNSLMDIHKVLDEVLGITHE